MQDRSEHPTHTDRRAFLAGLAASPFVLTGAGVFNSAVRAQAAEAGLIAANVCMVAPEVTEGPFYTDPGLVRRDITEGLPGVSLRMRMQVVSTDCTPLPGARVDIWHCDAAGNYSGYARQGSDGTNDTSGQTFLRGTQMSDAGGLVRFDTIYPGWYRGRTTHIHYKVFVDERTVLTSQIFFPDALSAYLFQSVPPYNNRAGIRDTVNANDGIAQKAGDGAYAAIREQSGYYDAALVVGVTPDAISAQPEGMGRGRPPGPPPGGRAQSDAPPRIVPGKE